MARAENAEIIEQFEEFYRNYYRNEIGDLAQKYPTEKRSLHVDWGDLYRFDPDLADDVLAQPEQMLEYAEEALRLYDLPVDVKLGQAHVRICNLAETTGIRDIRADHTGRLIAVRGIVRKATDVRPKIKQAAFECQRCGTLTRIPQSSGDFQEPHECQGCERQGPFEINFDQSEFEDSQKLRVQESPEGLRGGETPQSIDVNVEDDITGEVTAGDHVRVTGILRLEQQGSQQEKSPVFDFYMDGVNIEIEDEQFEDMDISDQDKKEIIELSNQPDIYDQMVGSMAPSIYGYEMQKLAIILQLFSGVTKHLPDDSRIRGDLHMLLIGDPGTGKCVAGDTMVTLGDGRQTEIRELVEANLDDPKPVDDGVYDEADFEVPSMDDDGNITNKRATKVWKREAPDRMYRIRTASGRELEVTPSHPLFVRSGDDFEAKRAEQLTEGQAVATAEERLATDGGATTKPSATGVSVESPRRRVTTSPIESIEAVEPDDDWVYDLEVEDTHTYLSNGVVSHNSQLLQYVKNLSPRSVYTSGKGSSSAGLCVTGDTRLHTEDGFRRIDEIVEEDLPDPVETETACERNLGLYTYDDSDGEMDLESSSHVWRMPERECRRIETSHGKEIEASTRTPLLTCGEDGPEWKSIAEIEAGDYVAVPRYDDIERNDPPVSDYIEFTNEKLRLDDDSIEFVRQGLCEEFGTLRDAAAALELSEDFIYDSLSNRYVPLEKLERIFEAIGTDYGDVTVERAMLRHGDSVRLPQSFDEDLLYLIGLVFGDGDIAVSRRGGNRGMVRISNSDEALLRRAADIIEEQFDKTVEIEYQDERVPCIRLSSATVARFFENVGMETPKGDLKLDDRLTTAEHADAFVRGLMDADGSVSAREGGGSSVLFSSISETLVDQLQLILETYGIRARVRERDRRGEYTLANGHTIESKNVQYFLELYGADIERYADRIGFESPEKAAALERICEDAERRGEKVPVAAALATAETETTGKYYMNFHRGDNPNRQRARAMLEDLDLGDLHTTIEEATEADLRWDEVVAAVDTGSKEVYDLTVPETHNFVGNGIVTHNTAAAVRDDFSDGQQWTLEAGALVLADQGIAAVDELDKMSCVTGDTLVHTADGIVEMDEFARRAASEGEIEHLDNGRIVRDIEATVWTMADDGRLVRRPVTAVHEYEAPSSLCEVTLESGESLTATPDHPFFVLDDGERVEREARDLHEGDWVYVPEGVRTPASDGGVATAPTTRPATDDSLSPARGAILGYIAGDGNVYADWSASSFGVRFTNTEEELLADFERRCREAFETEPVRHPSEQREDGVETVRLNGKAPLEELFDAGATVETYEGKTVPEAVTTASRETKAAFVRALADSEGTVDERAVNISSASYDLLLATKMLLLEFGVRTQIQTRERDGKRDVHVLAITADDSLAAFARHVGFTLERKRRALEAACERTTGDRAILDVLPESDDLLERARESLRLHQSECGLVDATYCNFETGQANPSLHRAETVLSHFERRVQQADEDRHLLTGDGACSWGDLRTLCDRYHVSQSELAAGTEFTQPQVSRLWGEDEQLRGIVADRLRTVVAGVAGTDLSRLRDLVRSDVRWRRVASVERTTPTPPEDDRVPILEGRLRDLLGERDAERTDVRRQARELVERQPTPETWDDLRSELERYGLSLQALAAELGVAGSTVSRWVNGVTTPDDHDFEGVRETALALIDDKREEIAGVLAELDERERGPKVYDLTVEGTHNFLANGMVVHNSEDQSAMHQALEQQEISVSKAGINATLKSRCSLLGAANPIHGRFDEYEPFAEQIDLAPPLISRFDLIFTVTDQPDEEEDRALAEHIIETNYAGELQTHRVKNETPDVSAEEVENVTEDVEPVIDPDLLRKYIAHAKRSCYPTMTEEAKEAIREFYVDLRLEGQSEDNPVPVTARKLEALVRLAEASARVRLSDTVEKKDADRVIDIVQSSLEDVGVDPETGELDADIIESGTSKSQRDRIKNLKGIIEDIEADYEEGAPVDEVLDRAEEVDMERSKAEHEIEKLKRQGEVYEPSTDHLRTT